jgi:hypothetical protein
LYGFCVTREKKKAKTMTFQWGQALQGSVAWAAERIRHLLHQEARRRETGLGTGEESPSVAPGASPPAPSFAPVDDLTNAFAFDNTSRWEGLGTRPYLDSRGIPTVGYGFALVVKGADGRFVPRPESELAGVGITLPPADRALLRDAAEALNGAGTFDPAGLTLSLDQDQARRSFDHSLPYYQHRVQGSVGDDRFARLDPQRQAVLLDFAYRRPAWFDEKKAELAAALDRDWADGAHNTTAAILGDMQPGDPRTRNNVDAYLKPMDETVYTVGTGDTLATIARKTGVADDVLKKFDSDENSDPEESADSRRNERDWNRIRAGERTKLPPAPRRPRSGRV